MFWKGFIILGNKQDHKSYLSLIKCLRNEEYQSLMSPSMGVLICLANSELQIRRGISILFYPISLAGHQGTTGICNNPFPSFPVPAALVELAKSIPVHSLILSSNLLFCLPLFLFPFTVPCRIVFAKPEDLATWLNHLSFRFLTRVRSSSYSPMVAWIFLPPHW